ncbi:MAG: BatA domain-containing protein, partial [Ascidiaceihabitans sp.]
MTVLGGIGFGAPWLLAALFALPILWLILRAVPPAPVRRRFPGVALLLGLKDGETVTDRTPWWLMLLRILAVAALIIGLAQPILNPDNSSNEFAGPKLIVVDGSWAGAVGHTQQMQAIRGEIDRATSAGQLVAVLQVTDPKPLQFRPAIVVEPFVVGLKPNPWLPSPENVAQAITHITNANASSVVWFSDGVAYEGQDDILSALNAAQDLLIFQGTQQAVGLTPAQYVDGTINVTTVRANAFGDEAVTILAQGRDPLGYNATLARVTAQFSDHENVVNAPLVLPAELRARVTSFEIEG